MAKSSKGKTKTLPGTPTPSTKAKSTVPEPYSTPPPALKAFLETLNPKHVYITHIDNHPRQFKIKIFTVPIILNIVLALGLVYRAQYILPYYAGLLMTIWGYDTPYTVDHNATGWEGLLDETVRRTLVLVFDVFLASLVLPWPVDFFMGSPESPTSWRRAIGFQTREIAVRRSRKWDENLPKTWPAEDADSPIYQERIMPAIDRNWVRAKTSYLMMDRSWDLDFAGMIKAHELVADAKNSFADFEKQVLAHSEEHGWVVWQVWKLDEGAQDEGRKKVVLFKDKLTAMGKENLFFRWIELMQYETSHPGGFTQERQDHAMVEATKLFEEQGVNFDKFWADVGGVEGMPGMETTA